MSSSPLTMKMKNTLFPTLESIRHEAFIYFVSLVSAVALFAVAASLYARPIGTLAVMYIVGMGMVIFSVTWDRFAALIARKKDARKEQPLLKISEGPTPTIDLHLDDGNTIGSFPLPTEAAEVLRVYRSHRSKAAVALKRHLRTQYNDGAILSP